MQKSKAIVMKAKDNVATVVENIAPDTNVVVDIDGQKVTMLVKESIPFGHKFAIKDIGVGETVMKYGESIGATTKAIKIGQHVHVHNVESCRGRGDK